MVAHTATSHAPSWNPEPSPLAPILPPPSVTDDLLDDLASTQFSLAVVALKHRLSLAQLLTWLNLPETREALALRESAAYAHVRHVAALNIDQAVRAMASIIHEYNHTAKDRDARDRARPGSAHREAVNTRKAAWLLLQFARIVPINESDLRRARDASRIASPRVARLLEEQACSEPAGAKNQATGGLPASANNHAPEVTTLPFVPDERLRGREPEPMRSEPDSTPTPNASEARKANPEHAEPEQAEADRYETTFDSQPLIVRQHSRESTPAPGLAPRATSLDNNISVLDQIDDPAFADPPEGGPTHAAAALVATGPPHTG